MNSNFFPPVTSNCGMSSIPTKTSLPPSEQTAGSVPAASAVNQFSAAIALLEEQNKLLGLINPSSLNAEVKPDACNLAEESGKVGKKKRKKSRRRSSGNEGNPPSRKKPKRPMTAYNFFFQAERKKILDLGLEEYNKAIEEKRSSSGDSEEEEKDDTGEEGAPNKVKKTIDDKSLPDQNGSSIAGNINSEKKEGNGKKKPHGKISFVELGKLIGRQWRAISKEDLEQYNNLADAESIRYRKELREYEALEMESFCHTDEGEVKKEQDEMTWANGSTNIPQALPSFSLPSTTTNGPLQSLQSANNSTKALQGAVQTTMPQEMVNAMLQYQINALSHSGKPSEIGSNVPQAVASSESTANDHFLAVTSSNFAVGAQQGTIQASMPQEASETVKQQFNSLGSSGNVTETSINVPQAVTSAESQQLQQIEMQQLQIQQLQQMLLQQQGLDTNLQQKGGDETTETKAAAIDFPSQVSSQEHNSYMCMGTAPMQIPAGMGGTPQQQSNIDISAAVANPMGANNNTIDISVPVSSDSTIGIQVSQNANANSSLANVTSLSQQGLMQGPLSQEDGQGGVTVTDGGNSNFFNFPSTLGSSDII